MPATPNKPGIILDTSSPTSPLLRVAPVDHQVIADVRLYKEPSRSDGTGRLIRVQSAYDADSSSNNIKTAIRIMRVSIGKMGEIYTCRQFPVLVNLPVQQKAEIDVRIDLGANQYVLRIG